MGDWQRGPTLIVSSSAISHVKWYTLYISGTTSIPIIGASDVALETGCPTSVPALGQCSDPSTNQWEGSGQSYACLAWPCLWALFYNTGSGIFHRKMKSEVQKYKKTFNRYCNVF